ncbi:MAG: hypothetical protein KGJ41_15065 [Rhodospirillales bacterium]|nr:hypothetical protein [Rhodospirillales bacterium]
MADRFPLTAAAGAACLGAAPPAPRPAAPAAPARLEGDIGRLDPEEIAGWALDPAQPGHPVALDIVADGRVVARPRADRHRPDLDIAGLGDGRCGFAARLDPPLSVLRDHLVQVRARDGGASLPGAPLLLARLPAPPGGVAAALADIVGDAAALAAALQRLLRLRLRRPDARAQPPATSSNRH